MKKILSLIVFFSFFGSAFLFANDFSFSNIPISKYALTQQSGGSDFVPSEHQERKDEKGWYKSFLLGFAFPQTTFENEYDYEVKQSAYDFDIQYMMIKKSSGLTFKFRYDVGLASTEDISSSGDNKFGMDMFFDFGVGFSPIRNKRFSLSFLGLAGFDFDFYTNDEKFTRSGSEGTYMCREWKNHETRMFFDFHLGLEGTATVNFTSHFGMFASLGVHFIVAGNDSYSLSQDQYWGEYVGWEKKKYTESNSAEITGNVCVLPTIGFKIY